MGGEDNHVYAFECCFSIEGHAHATHYEEIIKFCRAYGFYYAVKAEDTNCITEMGWPKAVVELEGKAHVHFMFVREKLIHSVKTGDRRYGCCRVSAMKEAIVTQCPSIAKETVKSVANRKYSLMVTKMTTDHCVVYFNKESMLKTSKLPDDMAILREYLVIKAPRVFNPEDDAHVKAYKEKGYIVPATVESVWDYLTTRWYQANSAKRVKRTQLQDEQAINLFHAINMTKPEMSKKLKTMHEEIDPSTGKEHACKCHYRGPFWSDMGDGKRRPMYIRDSDACVVCLSDGESETDYIQDPRR